MFSHIRAQNAAQKGTKCSAKLRKNYEPRRFHAANKSFLNIGWANQKNGADVNGQRSTVNSQRDKERKRLSSLKVCTVSKSACHNGQSAALLSDSGLVMYFSTLPAPSSSVPCILTILTHLKPGATPSDSMESSQYQPGGLYAREDGGASRMNTKVKTSKENMNEACNESIHAH